jgi:branched-chain amino acid transport system permease protein
MTDPLLGFSLEAFTDIGFWTRVGVTAGVLAIFTLGLQLNVGYTGIVNFGQAGFMAVGAYTVAILIEKESVPFLLTIPIAVLVAIAFGLVVGLPSLRLRADYFAIATIAFAEAIRLTAQNARSLTGGNQGIYGFDNEWDEISDSIEGWLEATVWSDPDQLFPLLLVVWASVGILTLGLYFLQRTPWGRVLRAIREDEDAARALGKNTFAYKLQSLAIASSLGAIAGLFLALSLRFVIPTEFLPTLTFLGYAALIAGGLASYPGVAAGALFLGVVYEAPRFLEVPNEESVRFILIGLILILLMAFRPQGAFGKREEMVLGE